MNITCVDCTRGFDDEPIHRTQRCRRCRMARFGEAVSQQLLELEDLVVGDADVAALAVLFLDQVKELQEVELG